MAKTFAYQAKDQGGNVFDGTIAAESERAVASFIREKGYYVTKIKEVKEGQSLQGYFDRMKGVKPKEVALTCRQLAIMINAGLPLVTALGVMIEQTRNPVMRDAMLDIYNQVQQGESFTTAIRKHRKIFPDIMIHMIAAGEVGGVLDVVLTRLAAHLEKDYKMREKVKSALTYPAVVICLAVGIVMFILTFVMPVFQTMFDNMGSELPLPTQILLNISGFCQNYWYLVLLAMVAAVIVLAKMYKIPKYRMIVDEMTLKLPVFGMLAGKVAVARFSRTLATLLNGGVPIIGAIDVVKNVVGNMKIERALSNAQSDIQDGFTLSDTLKKSKTFDPMVLQMISVGEETGQLDVLLEKIADFYEDDVDDVVSRLSSLLEPMMIVFLGVIIGGIVIAIALPMFDAVTNVGR